MPYILAVTMGDPSGIGVELTLKTWRDYRHQCLPFVLLADPAHVRRQCHILGYHLPVQEVEVADVPSVFPKALPVLPLRHHVQGEPQRPHVKDAPAILEAIEQSVQLLQQGAVCAMVTHPISKAVLYEAGFEFPGHTEFLAHLSKKIYGIKAQPVMLLWSEVLATVPVTIHIPLAQVSTHFTQEKLLDVCQILARDLPTYDMPSPRLALAGLNPHAGESGHIGQEEVEVIAPVVARLNAQGIKASGPHPADTLFHQQARLRYDVAICPYHDQALIPIKTLAFDTAVNITLGLPFLRTSPDHGVAYDIAGAGIANPSSFIAALQWAGRAGIHPASVPPRKI